MVTQLSNRGIIQLNQEKKYLEKPTRSQKLALSILETFFLQENRRTSQSHFYCETNHVKVMPSDTSLKPLSTAERRFLPKHQPQQ